MARNIDVRVFGPVYWCPSAQEMKARKKLRLDAIVVHCVNCNCMRDEAPISRVAPARTPGSSMAPHHGRSTLMGPLSTIRVTSISLVTSELD